MTIDHAYLIFRNDFKQRSWIDWLKTHISLNPPPYRFKGSIKLDSSGISFIGYDSYLEERSEFNIPKEKITQIYYGYDETYSTFQTRGMGLTWSPIRISFELNFIENEKYLYLSSGFNGVCSTNENVFNQLKIWLS